MNERLAKLTEQCYEYNETMQGAWFNKTKFAELIIKECALLCSDPVVVLQHFGIDSESE
jgi:hypothetical protein